MARQTTYDISVYRGDTYDGCTFTLTRDNTPINLTGSSIKMQVRENRNVDPVLELSLEEGLTLVDAAAGVFSIDEQIFDVESGRYLYDIEITFSDDSVKTYIKGSFTVTGDITHEEVE